MRQPAASLGSLGLRHTENEEIFVKARAAQVISLTKDQDFAHSVTHLGPPPQVIWLRCGDTSGHLRTPPRNNSKNCSLGIGIVPWSSSQRLKAWSRSGEMDRPSRSAQSPESRGSKRISQPLGETPRSPLLGVQKTSFSKPYFSFPGTGAFSAPSRVWNRAEAAHLTVTSSDPALQWLARLKSRRRRDKPHKGSHSLRQSRLPFLQV